MVTLFIIFVCLFYGCKVVNRMIANSFIYAPYPTSKVYKASYSGMLYTPLRCIIFFTNYQRDWKFLVNSVRIPGYRFPSSYCSYAQRALVCNVDPFPLPVNELHKSAATNEALLLFDFCMIDPFCKLVITVQIVKYRYISKLFISISCLCRLR